MSDKQAPFYCKTCGQLPDGFPVECPRDGEVSSEIEYEWMEAGYLRWHGLCDYADDLILLQMNDVLLDASNTAVYLNKWARKEKLDVRFAWGEYATGNPARRGRGQEYRECIVMFAKGASQYDEEGVTRLRSRSFNECVREVEKVLQKEGEDESSGK